MAWLYVFGQSLYMTKYITKFWLYYWSYRPYDQTYGHHSDNLTVRRRGTGQRCPRCGGAAVRSLASVATKEEYRGRQEPACRDMCQRVRAAVDRAPPSRCFPRLPLTHNPFSPFFSTPDRCHCVGCQDRVCRGSLAHCRLWRGLHWVNTSGR